MADEELLDQIDNILDNIEEFWAIDVTDELVDAVILAFTMGLADSATYIAELKGISVGVSFNVVDPEVIEFLKEFAAEMVRNINKGTRFYLRSMIYTGFREGVGEEDLVKTILEGLFDVSDFSENRVRSIARFEIAKAQTKGWIKQLDEVGVKTKTWITIGPDACEVCKENEAMGPQPVNSKNYLTVFKGEKTDGPPAHPNVERCHLGIPAEELDKMGMSVEWYTGKSDVVEMGGPGSGHWGHKGRKGKRGGSAPSKGRAPVAGREAFGRLKELNLAISSPKGLEGEYGDPDTYMMGATTTTGQTLQEAAREEFGGNWVYRKSISVRRDEVPSVRQSIRKTYAETQRALAEAGIEQVELYRGMRLSGDWAVGDEFEGVMNPISSWTSRKKVAEMFAVTRAAGTGDAAIVLKSTFPAERILMSGAISKAKGMHLAQEWLVVGSGESSSTVIDVR